MKRECLRKKDKKGTDIVTPRERNTGCKYKGGGSRKNIEVEWRGEDRRGLAERKIDERRRRGR